MTMERRDGAEAADMTARSVGMLEASTTGTVTDEQFERIRAFMDPAAKIDKADIFGYRLIACGDGVDAYYTRHSVDRGLKLMAGDLTRGQSVLGNHDYGTFSYGSSYGAEVLDADAMSRAYEGVFYPQHDRPEYRTTKWLVGEYYIPRGLVLNGQSTDHLIRGIETGAIRKASITFAPGSYECALDGKDLLMGLEALFVDPDEIECRHFPGLAYEGSLCYAWMLDSALLETSWVYKNASPSSMLLRKAEEMASRGMIPVRELVRLEERIGQRLPRPERLVFPTGTRSQEDPSVTKPTTPAPTEPQTDPAPPSEPTEPPAAPAPGTGTNTEGETTPDGGAGTPDTGGSTPPSTPEGGNSEQSSSVAEFVAATERVVAHISSGQQSEEDLVTVAEASSPSRRRSRQPGRRHPSGREWPVSTRPGSGWSAMRSARSRPSRPSEP